MKSGRVEFGIALTDRNMLKETWGLVDISVDRVVPTTRND